jgi:hypothetical protein
MPVVLEGVACGQIWQWRGFPCWVVHIPNDGSCSSGKMAPLAASDILLSQQAMQELFDKVEEMLLLGDSLPPGDPLRVVDLQDGQSPGISTTNCGQPPASYSLYSTVVTDGLNLFVGVSNHSAADPAAAVAAETFVGDVGVHDDVRSRLARSGVVAGYAIEGAAGPKRVTLRPKDTEFLCAYADIPALGGFGFGQLSEQIQSYRNRLEQDPDFQGYDVTVGTDLLSKLDTIITREQSGPSPDQYKARVLAGLVAINKMLFIHAARSLGPAGTGHITVRARYLFGNELGRPDVQVQVLYPLHAHEEHDLGAVPVIDRPLRPRTLVPHWNFDADEQDFAHAKIETRVEPIEVHVFDECTGAHSFVRIGPLDVGVDEHEILRVGP